MSKILVVDDEASIRLTLCAFLKNAGYASEAAADAQTASRMIWENDYDIVVTDIIMPQMNGMELLKKIREKSEAIQVIIMTGEPTVDTAITAVQGGANDYLAKPVSKAELLRAVNHADKSKKLYDEKLALERQRQLYQEELESMVAAKTSALSNAMQSIISLLATVVEARDPYTAGHQRRVGNLSAAIASKMKMDTTTVELIRICGYIHDIGKIGVPAEILSKPGKLSLLEMQLIKEHSIRGYEMLSGVNLPALIGDAIYQHHERCDGSGYPRGIQHKDILPEAHVIMVADVVEAMISHRPYRPELGLSAALKEIQNNAGVLYDPAVVAACVDLFLEDAYCIEDSERIAFSF